MENCFKQTMKVNKSKWKTVLNIMKKIIVYFVVLAVGVVVFALIILWGFVETFAENPQLLEMLSEVPFDFWLSLLYFIVGWYVLGALIAIILSAFDKKFTASDLAMALIVEWIMGPFVMLFILFERLERSKKWKSFWGFDFKRK